MRKCEGKMDERVREIEKRLQHPMFLKDPGEHLQSGQARDDIKYLLSRIKELEEEVAHYKSHYEAASKNWNFTLIRVKELEEVIKGMVRLRERGEFIKITGHNKGTPNPIL
jgi:hypothetical protein